MSKPQESLSVFYDKMLKKVKEDTFSDSKCSGQYAMFEMAAILRKRILEEKI